MKFQFNSNTRQLRMTGTGTADDRLIATWRRDQINSGSTNNAFVLPYFGGNNSGQLSTGITWNGNIYSGGYFCMPAFYKSGTGSTGECSGTMISIGGTGTYIGAPFAASSGYSSMSPYTFGFSMYSGGALANGNTSIMVIPRYAVSGISWIPAARAYGVIRSQTESGNLYSDLAAVSGRFHLEFNNVLFTGSTSISINTGSVDSISLLTTVASGLRSNGFTGTNNMLPVTIGYMNMRKVITVDNSPLAQIYGIFSPSTGQVYAWGYSGSLNAVGSMGSWILNSSSLESGSYAGYIFAGPSLTWPY